jgi:hypothetical protein
MGKAVALRLNTTPLDIFTSIGTMLLTHGTGGRTMKTVDIACKVLTRGDTSIGAATYPGRKRPAIIVQRGNSASVYGYFKDAICAALFMDELAELVGAKKEEDNAQDT